MGNAGDEWHWLSQWYATQNHGPTRMNPNQDDRRMDSFTFLPGALALLPAIVLAAVSPAAAMDQVTLRRGGKTIEVTGKALVEARDGGLLLLARDGVLWLIPPEEQVEHTEDSSPFVPLTPDEMGKLVLGQLPPGFSVFHTAHYVICYDTSLVYAKWCGALFEQLYGAFTNLWTRKKFELSKPEFPLVAVVFADRQAYQDFSRPALGEAGKSIIGYFGLISNRMTMYDLTGLESQGHGRMSKTAQINKILAQPEARRTIATIVHEATHQIAFNCGLQTRWSDCPRWFSEGIAMYFETPNLRNGLKRGWSGIGSVNRSRLEQFQRYLATRPADSLETLIRDDRRFTDLKQASDAYGEAWALTYFLLKMHEKEFVEYLRMLSAKKPLAKDSPRQRVDEFRKAFGELPQIDAELLRYMARRR